MFDTIVLDMDEVLTDLLTGMNSFYNEHHGTNFRREEYHTCNWWEVWGCTYEYADKMCYDFITSERGRDLRPVEGSVDGVRILQKSYGLVVATSRKVVYEDLTREWLERNYGTTAFRGVHLLNQYGGSTVPLKKSDVAIREEAVLAVEDQMRHVRDFNANGISCLLLDNPWNRDDELPSNTIRVYSWDDILREVEMREQKY